MRCRWRPGGSSPPLLCSVVLDLHPLAFFEHFVGFEEVFDLRQRVFRQVVDVLDLVVGRIDFGDGNCEQLFVDPAFVLHDQYADQAAVDDRTGLHRIFGQYEDVRGVTVL